VAKLKRCAHCGGEACISDEENRASHNGFFAYCSDCEIETSSLETKEEIVKVWNKRVKMNYPNAERRGFLIVSLSEYSFRIACPKQRML
jgi:Lar family restriction alleviation protein